MNKQEVENIIKDFNIEGEIVDISYFSNGLINTSCKITVLNEGKIKHYVLQKINKNVFKKPEEVMENISNVTKYIYNKLKSDNKDTSRKVLKFKKSNNGQYYTLDQNNDYWRMYKYIDNSVAYNQSDDISIMEKTGEAFGEFQRLLSDYQAKDLKIIIPHFHNTENRYELFQEALYNDTAGRASHTENECQAYLNLQDIATKMYKMQKAGELKLRVTHNDTKCNNVLFDEKTNEPLCVIDLDTVMPGLIGFDFGDAIRFGANSSQEDEQDLSKVYLDLEKFEAFAQGFVKKTAPILTQKEVETLPLGAITMTLECGLRFLTDYLNGDVYFKTSYPEHNLDRARCQLTLGLDMIKNLDKMQEIVNKSYEESLESEYKHE